MCWIPSGAHGIYDSQGTAIRDAEAKVDWLVTEAKWGAVSPLLRLTPVMDAGFQGIPRMIMAVVALQAAEDAAGDSLRKAV